MIRLEGTSHRRLEIFSTNQWALSERLVEYILNCLPVRHGKGPGYIAQPGNHGTHEHGASMQAGASGGVLLQGIVVTCIIEVAGLGICMGTDIADTCKTCALGWKRLFRHICFELWKYTSGNRQGMASSERESYGRGRGVVLQHQGPAACIAKGVKIPSHTHGTFCVGNVLPAMPLSFPGGTIKQTGSTGRWRLDPRRPWKLLTLHQEMATYDKVPFRQKPAKPSLPVSLPRTHYDVPSAPSPSVRAACGIQQLRPWTWPALPFATRAFYAYAGGLVESPVFEFLVLCSSACR